MTLFSSLQWWTLRPDPALIAHQPGDEDPSAFVASAGAENKEWALLYFPVGQAVTLRSDQLVGPLLVRWFNPRSGEWSTPLPLTGESLTPPDREDWVVWIGRKTPK